MRIVSVNLARENSDFHGAMPVGTRLLLLDGVTFPDDLLSAVAEKLSDAADTTGAYPVFSSADVSVHPGLLFWNGIRE